MFYLDNVSDEYGYRRLETLDECLDLFRKGPCRRNGQLISSYFINPLGCAQNKPVCDALLRDFFTILYLQDIPVYVLYTRRAENNTQLYEEYTASILREILEMIAKTKTNRYTYSSCTSGGSTWKQRKS